MIPHSRPTLGPEEESAVLGVLRSGQLAQGPQVEALELELAKALDMPRALVLANGTAALHLGLLALGVQPGDRVLLPAYACAALLHAVAAAGAQPWLVDCTPQTPDLDLEAARELLGHRARALVVVNPFGRPARLGPWAREARVLEDATHSLGVPGLRSPAACCSFYATKMLCAGEGGALMLAQASADELARDLRDYDYREHHRVRFNYKTDELSAALLRVQLTRLGAFLERRRLLWHRYREHLCGLPGVELLEPLEGQVFYRFVLRVAPQRLEPLAAALESRGVAARRPVFRPLHHYLGLNPERFPQAERFWQECLSLPLYPSLSEEHQEQVVEAVRQACELP